VSLARTHRSPGDEPGRCSSCGLASPPDEQRDLQGFCPGCLLDLAAASHPVDDLSARTAPLAGGAIFRALEVEDLLGRGGMSFVYRARHRGLDRPVALKILAPELAGRPGFAERFEREAQTMAALDHPRIVRITDFGRARGLFFIVMEYVAGMTLRQRLAAGRLPLDEALAIARDVCQALNAAHTRGVIHRDIKPENILLDCAGRAKVTDFGLAKVLSEDGAAGLTGTRVVMGTVRYMAPEQLEDLRAVDHRGDIFSLGVVLYELLTGEVPQGAFPLPSRRARVSRKLDRLVLACLHPEASGRPSSVTQVEHVLAGLSRQPGSGMARRRAWRLVLPGLAAAAVAAAGLGLRRDRGRNAPVVTVEDVPGHWKALGGSSGAGGVSNSQGVSRDVTMTLDRQGRPVLAWVEKEPGNEKVSLRRWNGAGWRDVGGSAAGDGGSVSRGPSRAPAIALDGQDNLVVAWAENHSLWLRRHRDDRWEELGDSATGGGVGGRAGRVDWPSLALDGRGQPVVAWCQDQHIFLRRFDGTRWRELGSSASGEGMSGAAPGDCRPSLALDAAGQPWVAWTRYRDGGRDDGGGELLLRRWDGSRWRDVAGPPAADGEGTRRARTVRLALTPAGHPVLAWRQAEPTARRFWIMVMAWNGRTWVELGGSARGRGLVSEGASAYAPHLALDRQGRPTVVWNALVGPWSEHDIYLKRWDGERWVELAGSGSGNGLSNNRGDSGGPVVALDAAGTPTVAWIESAPHNAEVFLRRFVPGPRSAREKVDHR
jgi:predicted Ser/Thr protein kinase